MGHFHTCFRAVDQADDFKPEPMILDLNSISRDEVHDTSCDPEAFAGPSWTIIWPFTEACPFKGADTTVLYAQKQDYGMSNATHTP